MLVVCGDVGGPTGFPVTFFCGPHAHLSTASEQIDSCMTNLEQSAMQCEPWSMGAGA